MQHSHDLNAVGKRFVEEYVVADRKAPNAYTQLGPLSARQWILGKHLKDVANTIEQAVQQRYCLMR